MIDDANVFPIRHRVSGIATVNFCPHNREISKCLNEYYCFISVAERDRRIWSNDTKERQADRVKCTAAIRVAVQRTRTLLNRRNRVAHALPERNDKSSAEAEWS